MLKTQLRALVVDHGLVTVLRTLGEVCADEAPRAGKHDISWSMGKSVIRHAISQLGRLMDVPGVTEPLSEAPHRPLEASPGSERTQPPPSRPSAPGVC